MSTHSAFQGARVLTSVTVLLAVLALSACRTYRAVRLDAVRSEIELGDEVRVVGKDGDRYAFEVIGIDETAIEGAGVRLPLERLASVEVERTSLWRSLLLGLGIGYSGLVVASAFVGLVVGFAVLG